MSDWMRKANPISLRSIRCLAFCPGLKIIPVAKAARAAGYSYEQLINRVVFEASRRYGLFQKLAGSAAYDFSVDGGGNHGR